MHILYVLELKTNILNLLSVCLSVLGLNGYEQNIMCRNIQDGQKIRKKIHLLP